MRFAVIALPRSRTAWLAQWLGVEHEPLSLLASLDGLPEGLVDTASALFYPAIRKRWPKARYLFVFRPLAEVIESARKQGLPVEGLPALYDCQQRAYVSAQGQGNCLAVDYSQLSGLDVLERVWCHLMPTPFDAARAREFVSRNIQADCAAALDRVDLERTKQLLRECSIPTE